MKPAAHAELAGLLDALSNMPALKPEGPGREQTDWKTNHCILNQNDTRHSRPDCVRCHGFSLDGDYDALVAPIVRIESPTWEDTADRRHCGISGGEGTRDRANP